LEEARIIDLVRNGEVNAFAEIIDHYQTSIIRYLYRLTGDLEMARDLTQDTFIQAYKGILKTNADISFRAWLYRIATNNALQHQRRKKLLSFIPFKLNEHDVPSAERTDRTPEILAINEALLKLPEEQRTCLLLHFVEGFKYREIAMTLGCSEDAVRKRVARGKKLFIDLYNQEGGGSV
jgi:RNA polymerase sigma-70 factor (ECF subfamily)